MTFSEQQVTISWPARWNLASIHQVELGYAHELLHQQLAEIEHHEHAAITDKTEVIAYRNTHDVRHYRSFLIGAFYAYETIFGTAIATKLLHEALVSTPSCEEVS